MVKPRHGVVVVIIVIFLAACMVLSLFNTGFRRIYFSSGTTVETLGLAVAREKGCFHCHGPFGGGGVPNPGSKVDVPAWQGFTFMMSMENEDELKEWILDGAPARLRESKAWQEERKDAIVVMPAYRKIVNPVELNHLLTFYHAVSGTIRPQDEQAKRGLGIAREKGCFTCHGPGGRIDMVNPRSVTGYIPAWNGPDYEKLVKSDEELREWILDGRTSRFDTSRWAQWFLGRQAIEMPAYRDQLTEEELEAIIAYIHWLRDPEKPGHEPRFSY